MQQQVRKRNIQTWLVAAGDGDPIASSSVFFSVEVSSGSKASIWLFDIVRIR
jgi:hypothetical protein